MANELRLSHSPGSKFLSEVLSAYIPHAYINAQYLEEPRCEYLIPDAMGSPVARRAAQLRRGFVAPIIFAMLVAPRIHVVFMAVVS